LKGFRTNLEVKNKEKFRATNGEGHVDSLVIGNQRIMTKGVLWTGRKEFKNECTVSETVPPNNTGGNVKSQRLGVF
jgi:hypothetical protein